MRPEAQSGSASRRWDLDCSYGQQTAAGSNGAPMQLHLYQTDVPLAFAIIFLTIMACTGLAIALSDWPITITIGTMNYCACRMCLGPGATSCHNRVSAPPQRYPYDTSG